ncbi:PREDICTED: LOW QUALITY PROTEIN: uncharacterized protein LOC108557968 [Nicrophorus vespilloides]|uniref:LOW QUALITY PROTEIN: uncharacterized protein LOC108557968 n=1 Tax=Nicrophorus vespilloides TaxID=110193 RepID=A0ABM1M6K6_NICVS|nr:PREDICTED: LOW QUALITY PROTEIN: uncharacterized protein LOC108557968 [Nicrophorus vespilloides]
MTVEYEPKSPEALLKISPVKVEDEASYKCEITYLEVRENCDVVQIIKLSTLVVPESVRILGVDGVTMANTSMLGPHDEGTQIELICEANAGRPTPKVYWYNGTKQLNALYSSHEDGDGLGTGTSKLQFTLSRGDLAAKFECKVESEALEEPIITWLRADVHVKPTKMELIGPKNQVDQGSIVSLVCNVFGARPPAEIKWFNNSEPMGESLVEQNHLKTPFVTKVLQNTDDTYTTQSILKFRASRYENGNAFHCYAENAVIRSQKETSLHELTLVEVYYPPVVTVSPEKIVTNETADILLLCSYVSNPMKLDGVVWAKNGKNITLNQDKYDGGTIENPPLIIKNVSREDMGEYTCTCKNVVGSEESGQSLYLDVEYPPSVEVIITPSNPVKERDQSDVTVECEVISGNPSNLTSVRWYLGTDMLMQLPYCNYTYNENGEPIGNGGKFCDVNATVLSLENVAQSMAGNYTCQGMNVAGWGPESEPSELIVYYPPSPAKLRFMPSKVIKTAAVTLECSVDSPGRPENITYLWYRGTYQVPDITTPNWTITPVLLETKSNFTCAAINEGGQSENATVYIDVSAPPAFIQNLIPYQGVLMNLKNISLTCRVECSPLCGITWFKDGHKLNLHNNPLYYETKANFPPDLRKNDFESVESTLIWNMTAWPGEMLDRTAPNSNYTCQSTPNGIGPGVNSTIEIAVDYPPENLTVSSKVVSVIENHKPDKVVCQGKGHPTLNYLWRRDGTTEPLSKTNILNLGIVPRSASGKYICEANNKYGTETTNVYLNVQYAPSCTIETVEYDGVSTLECTAHANPQDVTFTWKIKGDNDTLEGSLMSQKGVKGYLKLDPNVESFRTYQCFVNNSVGISAPCERDVTAYQEQSSQIGVPGVAPWWRQLINENLLILIAIIVGIIVFVIIVCIIIILVCKRKRANNKYTNAVEMEERENPDGQSPDTSATKWPLKPGVLLHVNKMHNFNMGQLKTVSLGYKTTSVVSMGNRTPLYKRSKNKVYARLERFKELLGFGDRDSSLPFGVYRGSAGVVTFKKFKDTASPSESGATMVSRKRKKPGDAPNPSSIADKGGLGAAPPGGGLADPLTDPDKGFYENLPFHGMQNPPNKVAISTKPNRMLVFVFFLFFRFRFHFIISQPISVISPIVQDGPSSLQYQRNPSNSATTARIHRNKSFHGFENYGVQPQVFYPSYPNLQFIPSIFYNLPRNFNQHTGSYTVGSIRTNPQFSYCNRVQSFGNLPFYANPFMITNPYNQRVVGRSEHRLDVRRTASGINLSAPEQTQSTRNSIKTKPKQCKSSSKRFNSLDLKKHKCYSPTFYSMRCKKHAKKRSIIYAVPKHKLQPEYQDLSDSIQFLEENHKNAINDTPKPAPRCSKHNKQETIYANVSKSISNNSQDLNESNNSWENADPEISTTQVLVHDSSVAPNLSEVKNCDQKPKAICRHEKSKEITASLNGSSTDFKSLKITKVTPMQKVSPNCIKPKTESPKGALHMQLQAKMLASARKTLNSSPLMLNSTTLIQKALSQTSLNQSNTSLDKIPSSPQTKQPNESETKDPEKPLKDVPEMPLLETQKWNTHNTTNNNKKVFSLMFVCCLITNILTDLQNAFYTLTNPHLKQISGATDLHHHHQYSATIPHQKHIKLIPRSLFQDQQQQQHEQQQVNKSKSFSSRSKPKKHFQIPLQKCHSFKFQTAESYFQPIKNIHEENFMRNGYISDLGPNYPETEARHHHHLHHHHSNSHQHYHSSKRDKQKLNGGPLVLRRPGDYHENVQFPDNVSKSVQLQYPQPVLAARNSTSSSSTSAAAAGPRPNGIVYADLDMSKQSKKSCKKDGKNTLPKTQKVKTKTEYATLQFNDVGQEIDV